jgi:glycosyltransferase involved in cell wall biosynthesis
MSENKPLVSSPNVSILIITYNEEMNLRRSIESVAWSDDIVVLDSYSTDRTKDIALLYKHARIYERPFGDYSSQRNFGLHSISFFHDWVFILDADETCPPELGREIIERTGSAHADTAAFIVRRKDFFEGRWMRCHYPVWLERLVRPKSVSFYGKVHEQLSCTGSCERLHSDLHHFPLENGIEKWIARHNSYSTTMAEIEAETPSKRSWSGLFSFDPIRRRKAVKAIYQFFPGRWMIFFIHRYFVKGAILNGISGLHFVLLETFYHFSVSAKIREKRFRQTQIPEHVDRDFQRMIKEGPVL